WIRAVRVLRAELPAGETAVVDAHLVGAAAAEAGTLAEPRAAAVERAVLPADAGARTLRVAGARCADAVPRVATVVAARVAGRAIRIGGADDAGLAGGRRRVAFGGIARHQRHREPAGAVGLEVGDAAETGDDAREVAGRATACATRPLDRRAIRRDADRGRREVVAAAPAPGRAPAPEGRRTTTRRGRPPSRRRK